MLVDLFQSNGFSSRLGTDAQYVPGELADQVAARNPGGQGKALPAWVRCHDRAAHLKAMGGGVRGADAVMNACVGHDGR